eukprot:TRINITY_DN1586_c1_g3_i2.p1 TRINITY_DN1586_c1_g3~~TRINITY_DN1586_c1_g3_i2.p1  ORF type:complete len:420 (-),score=55.68 TRINITY_DN1586_c1_g3_i2:271-1530(-)
MPVHLQGVQIQEHSLELETYPNNLANCRGSSIKKAKLCFTLESRRQQALERQKQSRFEQLALVRQLTEACLEEQDQGQEKEESIQQEFAVGNDVDMEEYAQSKKNGRRQRYVGQLMLADWMLEIPHDLCQNWLVTARAEGQQCLVIACRGRVITRLRSGRTLHRLRGTPLNKIASYGLTLLDAVYYQDKQTYYIMDVLCWKDYLLVECQAEFRVFWLQQQIAPELDTQKTKGIQFSVAQYQSQCQAEYLANFKQAPVEFVYDGFLFLHKQGHYQIDSEAPSPLALRWKDGACSRYPVDTDSKGNVEQQQVISLKIGSDLSLLTNDDPPTILGNVNKFQNQQSVCVDNLKVGKTVRTRLLSDLQMGEDGQPQQSPLLDFVTVSRGRPDSWSRILFQYYLRSNKNVSYQEILEAYSTHMEH